MSTDWQPSRRALSLRTYLGERSISSEGSPSPTTTSSTPRSGTPIGASTGPTRRTDAHPTPCIAGGTECSNRPASSATAFAPASTCTGRVTRSQPTSVGLRASKPPRRLSGTATCPRRSESTDTKTSATSNERWTHSLPPDRQTPTARGTISSRRHLNPAICGDNGGGGNRTRVRGRTGQSLYRFSSPFDLARTAGV